MNPNNLINIQRINKIGTAGSTHLSSKVGNLPTKNFQSGQYYCVQQITGSTLKESCLWVKRDNCPGLSHCLQKSWRNLKRRLLAKKIVLSPGFNWICT